MSPSRSSPRSNRPSSIGGPAQPLTYDVNHTDGYFLIDRDGHERFSDSNPPNLFGHLDQKLTGLLNAGGLKNLDDQGSPNWTLEQSLASIGWLVGRNIPSVAVHVNPARRVVWLMVPG